MPGFGADVDVVDPVVELGIVIILDAEGGLLSLADTDHVRIGTFTFLGLDDAPVGMAAGDRPGIGGCNRDRERPGIDGVQLIAVLDPVAQVDHGPRLFFLLLAALQSREQGCGCQEYVNQFFHGCGEVYSSCAIMSQDLTMYQVSSLVVL